MGLRARTALDFAALFVLCLVTVDSFATANEPHLQPAVAAASAAPAAAQAGPAPQPADTHQVRPNIYWISGASGSNNGVIVGDKGLILIDTKTTLDGEKDTLAAIAKISDKPITAVILTHNDLDHVGGLSVLPKGIEIISQQDCKRLMQEAVQKGGRGPNPDFMPTKTYDKRLSLTLDGEKLELYHWAPAHTAGDTVVYLPKEKVVFAGDILATQNPIPFIHLDEGGSASGWIETAKGMLAIDTDTYVAGHGDTADKAAFQQRLDRAVKEQADTKKLIAEGKSIDEIHQALGETTPNPPGPGGRPFPWFSDYVWAEAKK